MPTHLEEKEKRQQDLIFKELEVITPSSDRGVKYNPKFYELNSTEAPAVLVEVAFHDNKEDANWIINNIQNIGLALSKGVLRYFGIEFKPTKPAEPITSPRYFRVQIGAYSKKENAEAMQKRLKAAGFDAIIKYN